MLLVGLVVGVSELKPLKAQLGDLTARCHKNSLNMVLILMGVPF